MGEKSGYSYTLLDRLGATVKTGEFTNDQVKAAGITLHSGPNVVKLGERFFEYRGSSTIETSGEVIFEFHEVTQVEVEA